MLGSPTPNVSPFGSMWQTTATVSTQTIGQDATGAPEYTASDITDVPCTIDASAGSEAMKYGGGHAVDEVGTHIGYFPALLADGTALAIRATARITADGVTYSAIGPASAYSDGIQRVALEARP